MNVTTYTPKFRVIIVDQTLTNFQPIDTSSQTTLGEALKAAIHTITTSRRIGDAGQFSISLYPTKIGPFGFPSNTLSWDSILSPMNYIEIHFFDQTNLAVLTLNNDITVFRGFISTITRALDISSGTPEEM